MKGKILFWALPTVHQLIGSGFWLTSLHHVAIQEANRCLGWHTREKASPYSRSAREELILLPVLTIPCQLHTGSDERERHYIQSRWKGRIKVNPFTSLCLSLLSFILVYLFFTSSMFQFISLQSHIYSLLLSFISFSNFFVISGNDR
jgi:hypothetical protein